MTLDREKVNLILAERKMTVTDLCETAGYFSIPLTFAS